MSKLAGMRYETYGRLPNEMLQDAPMATHVISSHIRNTKDFHFKRSVKLINPVIEFGTNGDDFVCNRTSFRVEFDGYKISRIIKRVKILRGQSGDKTAKNE